MKGDTRSLDYSSDGEMGLEFRSSGECCLRREGCPSKITAYMRLAVIQAGPVRTLATFEPETPGDLSY